VCGEAAADPAVIPLLVGLGITELSVGPGSVAAVRSLVAGLELPWCRGLATRALALGSLAEVSELATAAPDPIADATAAPDPIVDATAAPDPTADATAAPDPTADATS
jgi:hypothetical protein